MWNEWSVNWKCQNCGLLVSIEKLIMQKHDTPEDVLRFCSGKPKFHHCANNEENNGIVYPALIKKVDQYTNFDAK